MTTSASASSFWDRRRHLGVVELEIPGVDTDGQAALRGVERRLVPLAVGEACALERRDGFVVALVAVVIGVVVGVADELHGAAGQNVRIGRGAAEGKHLVRDDGHVREVAFEVRDGKIVALEEVAHVGEGVVVVILDHTYEGALAAVAHGVGGQRAVAHQRQQERLLLRRLIDQLGGDLLVLLEVRQGALLLGRLLAAAS